MAMRTWVAALLVACSGETTTEKPAPAPAPLVPERSEGTEAEILSKITQPPEPGPIGKLYEKIAEHYGVGLARCPLVGRGAARQVYGTERDQIPLFGPSWEMEWDVAAAPPWDPAFDEVVVEDDWVTLLVTPGTERGWVSTRNKTYAYGFPPAVAGETVLCTSVHQAVPRVVRGKVEGDLPKESFVVPCLTSTVQVASDSTFVAEVPTPCTVWVEGGPKRSAKNRIDEGEGHVELTLSMEHDPLLKDDRGWSEAGIAKVEATLAAIEDRRQGTEALLTELDTAFSGEPLAAGTIKRIRYNIQTYHHKITKIRAGLEAQREGLVAVPILPKGPGQTFEKKP